MCWCFLTMVRTFSMSSSVSLAPRLGINANTCQRYTGGGVRLSGIHIAQGLGTTEGIKSERQAAGRTNRAKTVPVRSRWDSNGALSRL